MRKDVCQRQLPDKGTVLSGGFRHLLLPLSLIACFLIPVAPAFAQRTRQRRPPPRRPAPPPEQPKTIGKPQLVVQNGHSDNIRSVAYSPDGKFIASGGSDKTVKLWEVETGRMLRSIGVHRDSVTSVAFSPDGATIASASLDKDVVVSDIKSGRVLRTLGDHDDDVNSVVFSPDGSLIASGSRDQSIAIWDAKTGEVALSIDEAKSEVRALAFSPTGTFLASAGSDNQVRLWQVSDGQLIRSFAGHAAGLRAVAFSPDGQVLASAGEDKLIKIWRLDSNEPLRSLPGHASVVTSLAFARDGRTLISAGQDKTIRFWEIDSGKPIREVSALDAPIASLALSPDGRFLASASWVNIGLLAGDTGNLIRTFSSRLSMVRTVALSPDSRMLAWAAGSGVKLWDTRQGAFIRSLLGHSAQVNSVAFSPNGKLLASASLDRTIRIWDITTGKPRRNLTGHLSNVAAVAFSPDGTRIASGSVDKTVKLWDVATGGPPRTFEGHHSLVSAVAFSPNGRLIASGGYDNVVKLWDADGAKVPLTMTGHTSEVTGVSFSPDGGILASSSRDKTVKLWDVRTGQLVRNIEGHSSDVLAVAFSPNGRVLASCGFDKTVRLVDPQSGKTITVLEDHSAPVVSVAFGRDGGFIFTGSEDATVKVWSPPLTQPLATLMSLNEADEWLVVTPDGLFDGSPEGWRSILWRFATNTFDVAPVELFFNEFYHPGLLADVLSRKVPKAAHSLALVDRRQPVVRLALADDSTGSVRGGSRRVKVRIDVTQAGPDAAHAAASGARDVRLFRNGALVKAWRGDVVGSRESVTLVEDVSIVAGENQLTAYAFNKENIKSADAVLRVRGSDRLQRRGTAYMLLVGINQYANPNYNLKYAVADAKAFGEALQQSQTRLGRFSRIETIPLLDEQATRANILAALNMFAGKPADNPGAVPAVLQRIKPVEPEDALLVYFAGHGTAQKARFYLIPHDLGYMGRSDALDESGLNTLLSHSISDRDLEQAFEGIDATDLLMVIDACNSGQALESEEKRRGPMNSKGLAQLAYEKGIYILTAAQGYQAALEAAELGHGFLTYALVVEGLKNGAADVEPRDGNVLAREWLDYAVERVPLMQAETLEGARGLKVVAFVPGEEKIDPLSRNVQRPRVFYRRETEAQPFVIEKVAGGGNR